MIKEPSSNRLKFIALLSKPEALTIAIPKPTRRPKSCPAYDPRRPRVALLIKRFLTVLI